MGPLFVHGNGVLRDRWRMVKLLFAGLASGVTSCVCSLVWFVHLDGFLFPMHHVVNCGFRWSKLIGSNISVFHLTCLNCGALIGSSSQGPWVNEYISYARACTSTAKESRSIQGKVIGPVLFWVLRLSALVAVWELLLLVSVTRG